jgi:hypothetical protein
MPITITAIAVPEPRRGRLCCPLCGDHGVVPVALACTALLSQHSEVRIDRSGLHLDSATALAEAGSVIAITWRCERGHLFILRLRTISGSTAAETVALPIALGADERDRT